MKELVISPEAELELMDAARWYQARERDLGVRFLESLDLAFDVMQRRPTSFPLVR